MKKVTLRIPKYISGPISFAHYQVEGKDLLLFGDFHFENEGMCHPCTTLKMDTDNPIIENEQKDCYTLSAWIQKILETFQGTNSVLDLYLEDTYSTFVDIKKKGKMFIRNEDIHYDGRLGELHRVFQHCLHCKNLRYHFLDTRILPIKDISHFDFAYDIQSMILQNIENALKDFYQNGYRPDQKQNREIIQLVNQLNLFLFNINQILKDYTILCATSINFQKEMEEFIYQSVNELSSQKKTYFDDTYFYLFSNLLRLVKTKIIHKKYKDMDVHPVGKQFRKWLHQESDLENQTQMIESMSIFILNQSEIVDFSENEIDSLVISLSSFQISLLLKEILDERTTFNYLMDIYAIPRILYKLPHSILKIYSAGDNHIQVLKLFLDEFYPGSFRKKVVSNDSDIRCLPMRN